MAQTYSTKLGLPPDAEVDVFHIAYAIAYRMDYLITWNCAHIANGDVIRRLNRLNGLLGRKTPVIVTPVEMMEAGGTP